MPKILLAFQQLNMSYFYNKEKEEDLDFIAESPIKIGERFKKKQILKIQKTNHDSLIRIDLIADFEFYYYNI